MRFKTKNIFYLYLLIFSLALFFRLFRLDSIPYGFHVDEAKAAWNAYSILKTGTDDKGNFFPMYYDSFGDYRPTGLMYLIIPSLLLFGQNIFAVRFPFALTGALTFIPLLFIVKELFLKNYKKIGLATALIISLNPWHIIASRSTSESIVSMFLALWGIYFILLSITHCLNIYNWWWVPSVPPLISLLKTNFIIRLISLVNTVITLKLVSQNENKS